MKTVMCLWVCAVIGAGCAGEVEAPETLGDACGDTGEAWCARAIDCFPDGAPSHTSCVNDFVAACCGDDGTCGAPVRDDITADEWNDCLDGFGDLSCAEVEGGDLPPACFL